MIKIVNPYTPGAGKMPSYLAGRETILENAEMNIEATVKGYPQNPVVYYGLRGVGKTVILNAIEKKAEGQPVICEHIEVAEQGSFVRQIAISSQKILRELSVLNTAKDFLEKAKNIFTSFYVTYNPTDSSFTAGLSENTMYMKGGNLTEDMTELMVHLGKAAEKAGKPIGFFVDEIQYMKTAEMEALVNALHRCNQLRLPIIFYGAGLPKVLKIFGEVKSYSERLFQFVEIDGLKEDEAVSAIEKPAEDFGIQYETEAIEEIVKQTKGYPYFIQAFCSMIWRKNKNDIITLEDVISAENPYYEELDQSFFKVRFERCTKREQDFLFAMASCGELPCTLANVAQIMKTTTTKISPFRATLIDKGLIYSAGHGLLDFTVPQFDDFLRRIKED